MATARFRSIRRLIVVAAVAACGGGAVGSAAPDRSRSLDALVKAERDFAALASDSSVQVAFEANIAADGLLFRPGPVDGHSALLAQPMDSNLALVWEPAWADVSAAGDLGYTTGPWRAGSRGTPRDSLPAAGQYVTLWRRTSDGFRFALDFGINHEAAALEWPDRVGLAPAPAAAADVGAEGDGGLLIADQDLAEALAAGDPAPYRAYATDAVRVLRNGAAPAFGVDALVAAAPAEPVRYSPVGSVVASSNDLGYTYGEIRAAAAAPDPPAGYYLRIWRRQGDGSWKLALDLVSIPPG